MEIVNNTNSTPQGTAGDNGFANRNTFSFNAINYNGTYASTTPLVAIGNAYNANVIAPLSPLIITGTEQYLTMNVHAAAQPPNSTNYVPVSGFTSVFGTAVGSAAQSWGQTGVVTANSSNCGQLSTAPGVSQTYTFKLVINGLVSLHPVTCTFAGASPSGLTGAGSGNVTVAAGQTLEWKAIQSSTSLAANPTINLVFARQ